MFHLRASAPISSKWVKHGEIEHFRRKVRRHIPLSLNIGYAALLDYRFDTIELLAAIDSEA